MRRRRSAAGISLIELLVAASLLGTAVVATAASVLESAEHQRANARVRAVTPVLTSLLDEVRGAAFEDVDALFGGATRTLTGIPDCKDATATYTVTDVATGSTRWFIKRVDVVVAWTGASGPVSMNATTYVAEMSVEAQRAAAGSGSETASASDDGSGSTSSSSTTTSDAGTTVASVTNSSGITTSPGSSTSNGNGNGNGNGKDK